MPTNTEWLTRRAANNYIKWSFVNLIGNKFFWYATALKIFIVSLHCFDVHFIPQYLKATCFKSKR